MSATSDVVARRIADALARLSDLRAQPVTELLLDEMDRLGSEVRRLSRRVRVLSAAASEPTDRALHDLSVLLDRACAEVADDCATRGIVLRRLLPSDLPALRADAELLVEAIRSVLDNAIHAIGERGTIEIRGRLRSDRLTLEIRNDGPAISPEVVARLSDAGDVLAAGGIGLAVVRRAAEAHGGTVRITSEAGWTVVAIELPCEGRRAPAAAEATPPGSRKWAFSYPARPLGVALAA